MNVPTPQKSVVIVGGAVTNGVGAVLKFPGGGGYDCGGGKGQEEIVTLARSRCPCLCFQGRFRSSTNRPRKLFFSRKRGKRTHQLSWKRWYCRQHGNEDTLRICRLSARALSMYVPSRCAMLWSTSRAITATGEILTTEERHSSMKARPAPREMRHNNHGMVLRI